MAITEQDRHRMYQRLEEVLGSEEAATLMEHLPPVGWADVATKRDIDQLAVATKRDIEQLGAETKHAIEQLAGRLDQQGDRLRGAWRRELLMQTFALIGANTALVAAAFAAARLA